MIELFHELAELSAVLARMGQVVIEAETPVAEPEPVDEFPEIEGVIYV